MATKHPATSANRRNRTQQQRPILAPLLQLLSVLILRILRLLSLRGSLTRLLLLLLTLLGLVALLRRLVVRVRFTWPLRVRRRGLIIGYLCAVRGLLGLLRLLRALLTWNLLRCLRIPAVIDRDSVVLV
ncbi:hypothetical protein BKG76_09060 [Mycobacteroides franklinii]|uniref:Uncharacterized protein n=1 Tax=Mycobacteroides franklinii TaxID=948102 RepID=A0A1S1L1X4_9MYCO|nr:hypothetical protein BKG76_09060 [Mycobacteroides franklinii]